MKRVDSPRTRFASLRRYLRAYAAVVRSNAVRELHFRANFCGRCVIHVAWISMQLFFNVLVLSQTSRVSDWGRWQFLVFIATSTIIGTILNGVFIASLFSLPDLVRTGALDHILVQPLDVQFLLSCRRIDLAVAPQLAAGVTLLAIARMHIPEPLLFGQIAAFGLFVMAGTAVLYSIVLVLAASSVWLVRFDSLFDLWWSVMDLCRCPANAIDRSRSYAVDLLMVVALPALLALNVPARYAARLATSPFSVAQLILLAACLLGFSRWFLFRALRAYRSAGG